MKDNASLADQVRRWPCQDLCSLWCQVMVFGWLLGMLRIGFNRSGLNINANTVIPALSKSHNGVKDKENAGKYAAVG